MKIKRKLQKYDAPQKDIYETWEFFLYVSVFLYHFGFLMGAGCLHENSDRVSTSWGWQYRASRMAAYNVV